MKIITQIKSIFGLKPGLKPGDLVIRSKGGDTDTEGDLYMIVDPIHHNNEGYVSVHEVGAIHRRLWNKGELYVSIGFNSQDVGIVGIRDAKEWPPSYRRLTRKEKNMVRRELFRNNEWQQKYIDIIKTNTGLFINLSN